MTRAEITAFFPRNFLGGDCHLGATSYAVPTLAWLRGPFWEFFRGELWDRNLDKWIYRWECRDFARLYAAKAVECWARTQGGTADDGLAVGEIWFQPDRTPGGHAICPVFTEQGLVYLDPQNNTPWPLSADEFASRYFVRF